MKNRFRKALVWLTCAVMMMTLWTGTATAEGEKNTDFLGKPFPDFSVTDTEGKTFTLSEALKDHQAAMIVFWATWCGPCEREFPYMEEVYQKYGDRVAFIALNEEKRETDDQVKAYRAERGLTIPMGHSENDDLYRYIGGVYLPDTVVVDRFGNAVFFHDSAFKNPEEVARVLETFLGDGYTHIRGAGDLSRKRKLPEGCAGLERSERGAPRQRLDCSGRRFGPPQDRNRGG